MSLECGGTAPHGQKRRAQDELTNDQRLVKRFNLLNLDHNGKLYTAPNFENESRGTNGYDDSMQLDDSKNKIYIYNLDDELKAVEDCEENLVFLPDIERKLNRIPKSVLRGNCEPLAHNEVVLYQVPSSLSVPEDQDNVRKAIIESRARARQRQAEDSPFAQEDHTITPVDTNGWRSHDHYGTAIVEEDEDAMDLG